jgi:hypothetical protein
MATAQPVDIITVETAAASTGIPTILTATPVALAIALIALDGLLIVSSFGLVVVLQIFLG